MKKKAFITGILGQDGSYLAEFLLEKGYEVHGLVFEKESELPKYDFLDKVTLHEGDLNSIGSLRFVFEQVIPDEVYNLAGITDLATATKFPYETIEINCYGVGRLVNEAIAVNKKVRIFQAGSAQMFQDDVAVKHEETVLEGTEPYADAKIQAHEDFVVHYRQTKDVFVCTGFLFNHESPRRDSRFVTNKIVESFRAIKSGELELLELGNMNAKRDWSYAGDFVEAMWMMLQADEPKDYVLASGENHTVKEFVDLAAEAFGFPLTWEGEGETLVGKDESGKTLVSVNKDFYKEETQTHKADISKITKELGWKPKTSLKELVSKMVEGE